MTDDYVKKVAEAVQKSAANQASNYPEIESYIEQIDLDAIIASVPRPSSSFQELAKRIDEAHQKAIKDGFYRETRVFCGAKEDFKENLND